MSRQMPELYLRGAIFNETMKNLTEKQQIELEDKINELLQTPSLAKSREKFCQTLANTIGSDYKEDKNAAMQEYRIALMKAVVYIMFHKPNLQVFDDPTQTRKLVSQITYNYMKQILNENKIPKSCTEKNLFTEPYIVAHEQISNILTQAKIKNESESDVNSYVLTGDIGLIDLKCAKRIGKIKHKYSKMGVYIKATDKSITIAKERPAPHIKAKIKIPGKIHVMNLDYESEENDDINRYNIEYEISKQNTPSSEFDPTHMRSVLPKDLQELFDIITNTPDEISIEPNKNEMAKYLNISVNEVNKRLNDMKLYYYACKV
jgi:hypothetical protein